MNFYDQAMTLAYLSVAILLGIVAYDLYAKRRARFVAVRKKTLREAEAALRGPAHAASVAEADLAAGRPSYAANLARERAATRARIYGRAADLVRSIPVDRL